MSIVPVYEALARLESEYLVQNIPRSGTRVRIPSPQDLRGFFTVREGLETQAARLFVQTARESDREYIKQAARIGPGIYQTGRQGCRHGTAKTREKR